ncbi:hypothetical protein CRUP_030557 [Coryphaenoides rupestris]|nr:hypothetical protein CRUP_030557 [Coryphaenoides rupestris]
MTPAYSHDDAAAAVEEEAAAEEEEDCPVNGGLLKGAAIDFPGSGGGRGLTEECVRRTLLPDLRKQVAPLLKGFQAEMTIKALNQQIEGYEKSPRQTTEPEAGHPQLGEGGAKEGEAMEGGAMEGETKTHTLRDEEEEEQREGVCGDAEEKR